MSARGTQEPVFKPPTSCRHKRTRTLRHGEASCWTAFDPKLTLEGKISAIRRARITRLGNTSTRQRWHRSGPEGAFSDQLSTIAGMERPGDEPRCRGR